MIKPRNMLWLVPLLLLISFPFWKIPLAVFLEPRGGYDPGFGRRDDVRNFELKDIIIHQDQKGRKTAVVRSEKAFTTDTPNEYILESVNADLYGEGNDQVLVVAEQGTYNTDTRELLLENNVRIVRIAEKQKLFTERLYYYDATRKIHAPVPTRLVGNNIEIRGQSLDYDLATNQYRIGGRVSCTISSTNSAD